MANPKGLRNRYQQGRKLSRMLRSEVRQGLDLQARYGLRPLNFEHWVKSW